MTQYKRVSELIGNNEVSLMINRTSNEDSFDIMKFQPKAKLSYSKDNGIHCSEEGYEKKVNCFLDLVVSEQPGLVVTPEGAIPFELLNHILASIDKWPGMGRLWCLGMSGISISEFQGLIGDLKADAKVHLYIEENICYKSHVNSICYLFRVNNDELGIIIQLKNNHMADRGFDHEGDHLSLGNTVYIFDLNREEITKNVFVGLICADAIQLSASEMVEAIKNTFPLIVNIQCNSKPYNHRFVSKRNTIASDTNLLKQRQLVANWAKGSEIENAFVVKDSGNIYYNQLGINGHSQMKDICSDKEFFMHRMKNQLLGITYFTSNLFDIWKFPDEENILRFFIRKEEVFGVDQTLSGRFDPTAKERYMFKVDEGAWKKVNKYCVKKEDYEGLDLYISADDSLKPLNFMNCDADSCRNKCDWLYNDFFLGICLGGYTVEELNSDMEKSNRTLICLNEDSVVNTDKKRELFMILTQILENNDIPIELNVFLDNIKYCIDNNAAETGSDNIFNVSVKNAPHGYPYWAVTKGIFTVLDTMRIDVVQKVYERLYKSTSIDNRDQILIYYRKNGTYIPYIKPHSQKKIIPENSTFTKNVSSIYKGEGQYEED